MANGLFTTLLGVRTRIEGFPTTQTGVIMAFYFLGLFLGARYAVRVVAIAGHIRAFAAFTSMMSIAALIHVLYVDPYAWMATRVMSGFCMAGLILVTESWLNERADNRNRGTVLSMYMFTNYLGSGTGQFLLPLADPSQFHLFSLVSIIFSVALIPILMTRSKAPTPAKPSPMDLPGLYRISPAGMIGSLCAGLINASFFSLGPVFTRDIGLSLGQTSAFMSSVILGGLLLQWPMGRISDRLDRRLVMGGVALGFSLCAVFIALHSSAPSRSLFVAAVCYGSFVFTLSSLCAAHTNDLADPGRRIQTAGGLLVAYGIGAIAGPVIASQCMERLGSGALWGFIAAVGFGFCLYVLLRTRLRVGSPGDPKKPFLPVPSTQYSSRELYDSARRSLNRNHEPDGLDNGNRDRRTMPDD